MKNKVLTMLALTVLALPLAGCGYSDATKVSDYESKIQAVSDKYMKIVCDNSGR